jgi:hypothetical protein
MSREATAPIPYASATLEDAPPTRLQQPLPQTLDALALYAQGDPRFPLPHWVRMRAAYDPAVGARYLEALRALAPLVSPLDADREAHLRELALDPKDRAVQRFAAWALADEPPGPTADRLFAFAAAGLGPDFNALFTRPDAPLPAHLLRLSALRDFGGMPWSDAFATRIRAGLPALPREAAAWTIRLIAELRDPAARAFLATLAASDAPTPAIAADIARFLANPPAPDPHDVDDDPLPTDLDGLELLALDERKDPKRQARRALALGALAERDWNRARRLASSIHTDDWRLDEILGALLNYGTRHALQLDLFERRLLDDMTAPLPTNLPSARELLRSQGRVLRFDTTSIDGIVEHDHLAYLLGALLPDAFEGVDFLEIVHPDQTCTLHGYADGRHYAVDLDTSRSVIDPYGLVGLGNLIARDRGRPERFMLAAEDKGMCEVVAGDEAELRGLVNAGLLWIRAGFRW